VFTDLHPELGIVCRKYTSATVCLQETHLCSTHTSSLKSKTSYCYENVSGHMVNGGTAIFVLQGNMHIAMWTYCKPPYKLLLYGYSWWPLYVKYAVCISHCTLLLLRQISRTYSPSSLFFFYCWKTSAWHHIWGSKDKDKRSQVIETLITMFNLVVKWVSPQTYLLLLVT
jgi:hypothetical protein